MLPALASLQRGEGKLPAAERVDKLTERVAQTHVQRLRALDAAVERDAEHPVLARQILFVHAVHGAADFKDTEGVRIAQIGLDLTQLRGDHGAAQQLRTRVGRAEDAQVRHGLHAQRLHLLRVLPDVGMHLVEGVAVHQQVLDAVLQRFFLARAHGVERRLGRVHVKVVVAVDTGDLLDDVGLDGHVLGGAPGGHGHVVAPGVGVHKEAEGAQRTHDILVADGDAGVAVHKAPVEIERDLRIAAGVFVRQGGDDLHAAVDALQQPEEAGDGGHGHLGVEALFVARGGVGAVAEAYRGLADGGRVEVGGLQRQAGGVGDDLAVQTAHDARDGHGLVPVADHQGLGVDVPLRAVEGLEGEGRVEAADADALHLAAVKGVHGLADLQHQVVGEVRQQVDRAHTAVVEADADRHGAHVFGDALHGEAGIAQAPGILDLQIQRGQRVVHGEVGEGQGLERAAGQGGKLARDAVVAPEVGPVGQGFVVHLEDDVLDGPQLLDIRPVGHGGIDLHDAAVVVADAELFLRAAHAEGHLPGQRAGSDVDARHMGADFGKAGLHAHAHIRRAADHVYKRFPAAVHLQQVQLCGGGVRLHGFDLSDHDAAELAALEIDIVFHLGGGQRKAMDQIQPRLPVVIGQIDIFGDPVHRYKHSFQPPSISVFLQQRGMLSFPR